MAVKESIDEYVFGDDPCLLPKAKKNNVEILDIVTEDSDLEDIFVQLTNH